MFIPLRTDRPSKRRPIVTEGLIITNLVVYLVGLIGQFTGVASMQRIVDWGHYDPGAFTLHGLFTYQFLHDPSSVLHLGFNMLFLWVFGAAVEARLGRIGFLGFYLIGGIVAAIAHAMISQAPVIGASGSIAAVTGAFLALFPRSKIKVLVIFFFIGLFDVPALWFIAFFFAIDIFSQLTNLLGGGGRNVAYMAHIAGYVYGFAFGFALLATGVLKHEEFDVFYLFKQYRRRAAFRTAARDDPAGMFDSAAADTAKRLGKANRQPTTEAQLENAKLRAEINRLIDDHDLAGAGRAYRELLESEPTAVLIEQRQLDLGNQLYGEQNWEPAARAYELFLDRYPSGDNASRVRLLLGMVYTRHLHREDRARELITAASKRIRDPDELALAEQLLNELGAAEPST